MVPKPPLDIKGHCSAIYKDTLYLFSPAGFQSIQLKDGAQWKTLSSGISVEGGICVSSGTAANIDPSLYIVGGRANSTQSQFSGLQRFSYATQQWENISPVVPVTQNRQGHGATFLAQSGHIAMYAGSQDSANTNPSSQSFLISAVAPFNVLSFTSLPPPLSQPMLMPWNESHALAVGGSAENKGLFLFGPQGWSNLGTSLSQPLLTSATQCTIVTADDGTKVLQEYNLGESPNQVSRYLLYTRGQILPPGSQIGAASSSGRKDKRQLTVDTWPAYNATGAPSAIRTSYSIAQGSNGVAVISGGSDSTPVVLFNEKQNTWIDPNTVFGSQPQVPISNTMSSASRTSASATASASPSQLAAKSGSGSNSLTVLGAVLGTVLGVAAIIILIILCMRRRGTRSMSRQERREAEDEKANRLSFADQGTDYMPSTAKSRKSFGDSVHNDSVTSLQIFQGQLPGHRRAQKSDSSTAGLVYNRSPLGQLEPFELGDMPKQNHERTYSGATQMTQVGAGNFGPHESLPPLPYQEQERSGWSQYFSNNDNVTNLGVGAQTHPQTFLHEGGNSYRSSNISASEYGDAASARNTAANMKPLELNMGPTFDSNRASTYTSGVGRAVSTGSGYDTSHYSTWTDDRASQISGIMPVPPIGSGPSFGNAFARPQLQTPTGNVATPVPRPSPGYETGDSLAYSAETVSSGSRVSGGPAAAAQDFPMPKAYLPHESPKAPKSPGRGPVLRKMTGSEDMSWLNINAGRGS